MRFLFPARHSCPPIHFPFRCAFRIGTCMQGPCLGTSPAAKDSLPLAISHGRPWQHQGHEEQGHGSHSPYCPTFLWQGQAVFWAVV